MGFESFHLSDGGFVYADSAPAYNFGTGDFTVEAWVKTFSGGTVIGRKEPCEKKVGIVTKDGKLRVKEGALGADWVVEWDAGVKQFMLAGDRIGILTGDGKVRVKQGAPGADWVVEWDGDVKQFMLAGDRIGILTGDGKLRVKEGGLSADWVVQWDTDVKQFMLAGDHIGILTGDGKLRVKEGALGADWVVEWDGDVKQFMLAGDRIGILTGDGKFRVKEGALGADWVVEWDTDVKQFMLAGDRIGILTGDGKLRVKEGALGADWVVEWDTDVKQFMLAGDRIGILTGDDKVRVKEGALGADWVVEWDSDVEQFMLIAGADAGQGGFWLVVRPDGSIRFTTDDSHNSAQVDSTPNLVCDGVWHHVAATRFGGTLTLYLDAQRLSATLTGSTEIAINVNNTQRLTIGTVDCKLEAYRSFYGNISEVRLWSIALSRAELSERFRRRLPPDARNLVGYWPTEFGLAVDFSFTRNRTSVSGMAMPSTNGPGMICGDAPAMLFLFRGVYATSIKSSGGKWSPDAALNLAVTSMGFVVLGERLVAGAVIAGNSVTWPSAGNLVGGNLTFRLSSNVSPDFWQEQPKAQSLFEGILDADLCRGVIQPTHIGCSVLLNIGTGLVLSTGGRSPGGHVELEAKTLLSPAHHCIYDNNLIVQMMSDLALSVHGAAAAGEPIILAAADPDQTYQRWLFGNDRLIRLQPRPSLAIAADDSEQPVKLILADVNPNDPMQQWVSFSSGQFVWNGVRPNVLSGLLERGDIDYGQIGARPKETGSPMQLWCSVSQCLICEANALALSVKGPAVPGAILGLTKINPSKSAQAFSFERGGLIHIASGLPVKLVHHTQQAVLGALSDKGPETSWTMSPTPMPAPLEVVPFNSQRRANLMVDEFVSYTIWIGTSSAPFAGTDDRVEIELEGDRNRSGFAELKTSETHDDPFEAGCIDRFTVRLRNVGKLNGVQFRYAENAFFPEVWILDSVRIFDPTTVTTYARSDLNRDMMRHSWIGGLGFRSWVGGTSASMSLGKAPSDDAVTRGWVDHTWIEVRWHDDTGGSRTTYFDCAGGHSDAVKDVVVSGCDLDTAVRMATGFNIDTEHPLQEEYGKNDVAGVQTCGIRASGSRNWDGQCHQMANRLLYICSPWTSLDDVLYADNHPAHKQVAGYGLSRIMFGPYGIGFADWCEKKGFPAPDDSPTALFDFISRRVKKLDEARIVTYWTNELQKNLQSGQIGPKDLPVKEFFQHVMEEGISNSTIAKLVCLPEDKVVEEQQP